VAQAIAWIFGLAGVVFTTWCTIIAFVGGTLPVLGWELEGGFGTGTLWVFVIDPIVLTLFYWVALGLAVPLSALFDRD
jgi:hypothetical protein